MKVCTDSCLFGAWAAGWSIHKKRILDIGAGTGLLMLMLAQQSSAMIDGIEVEPGCYEQLKSNLSLSPWRERLHPIFGDVRDFQFKETYDFIISNPPFFSSDLLSESQANRIARHTIHLSIPGLFEIVSGLLSPEGSFALLIPYHRLTEIQQISQHFGLILSHEVSVLQTPAHRPFRVLMLFEKHSTNEVKKTRLVIKNNEAYTPEFVAFLKSYYLHL
jgi:tRNA1Val (adenine37-N6)-methyltransferase